jgi:DNA-binding NarL/FixJ family response regulator
VSDRPRVFLVARTSDELARLRDRLARHDATTIVGEALLRAVESGEVQIPAGVDAIMMSPRALEMPTRTERTVTTAEPLVEQLTPREHTVLALVADGLGNREIARALDISEHTVKFHLASVFGKLGVSSRTEASRRALRLGLIDI